MTSPFTDKRDRIEQALTFDAGCEPSAQEIIDALNRAGYQITPQAGEEAAVDKYVDDYVFEHDEGYYTPTTAERTLIKDAIMGFLPLLDDAAADCTAPPRPLCDGNHAAPACADPECWQRPSPVDLRWTGCNECDEIFPCFNGEGRCLRLPHVVVPPSPVASAKTLNQWHEDFGPVVWFCWDAEQKQWLGEPAWIGTPNDDSWPEYHTHWIPHPDMPPPPDSPGATEES